MADELAFDDEGRDIAVIGVVASLPVKLERGVRFEFDVERVVTPNVHVPSRVLLGWYSSDLGGDGAVQPGERWAFTVRLKRPHGTMNPGGFDFEAWMLERNLRASGYVRTGRNDPPRDAPASDGVDAALRDRARALKSARDSCSRSSKANDTAACCWRWCSATSARSATPTGRCSTAPALDTWSASRGCTSR